MRRWWRNRVVVGLVALLGAVAVWEFRLKPQFRPMYESGVVLYRSGEYDKALREFAMAYQVAPNEPEVVVMMGWTNVKLRRLEEARFYFQRAQRLDPGNDAAQFGAALVAWQTERKIDLRALEKLAARRGDDADVQALLAAARRQK